MNDSKQSSNPELPEKISSMLSEEQNLEQYFNLKQSYPVFTLTDQEKGADQLAQFIEKRKQ